MFDPEAIDRIRTERQAWEARELAEFVGRQPEARSEYRTGSGLPVQRVYTPEDVADTPWSDIGWPGRWPFTRGPYPDDVPRPALDDAADRGFRHRRGHERPLQVPHRAGT